MLKKRWGWVLGLMGVLERRTLRGNRGQLVICKGPEPTICVSHLLLPGTHVGKVVDNGLGQILQTSQLHLQWLQFLCLGQLHRTAQGASLTFSLQILVSSCQQRHFSNFCLCASRSRFEKEGKTKPKI